MHPLIVLLLGFAVVIGCITWLRLHAFLSLILAAATVALVTRPLEAGNLIAKGFGQMATSIGIIVAMAAIIGKCLLDSGGAERIVNAIRGLFGERRLSPAFATSSFVLGIPVFFDTVFYLLMPLGRAAGKKSGKNYLLFVLSIVAGGTMAHSLVPPTPGPLMVADKLGVNLLDMILGGLAVGSMTVVAGLLYAHWANRRWPIPVRDTEMDTAAPPEPMASPLAGSQLPPLWLAFLPILLPLVLLSGQTTVDALYPPATNPAESLPVWAKAMQVLGDKNVALILAAIASLALLARNRTRKEIGQAINDALASGGVIILITSAGGAFGEVIKETSGIIEWIKTMTPSGKLALLPIAWGITALIRIAQGSATVAMVTAVAVVGGLATDLPYHPVYLALAIGCGSKPVPWLNDSGFWIISRMSGMTTAETLKTASVMMSLMGLVGLPIVMLGAAFLPLR